MNARGNNAAFNSKKALGIYLQHCKELQVFPDSESVKEDIVLGTDAETVSDLVHVAPYVISIDDCCTSRRCVQTWQQQRGRH